MKKIILTASLSLTLGILPVLSNANSVNPFTQLVNASIKAPQEGICGDPPNPDKDTWCKCFLDQMTLGCQKVMGKYYPGCTDPKWLKDRVLSTGGIEPACIAHPYPDVTLTECENDLDYFVNPNKDPSKGCYN